MLVVIEGQVAIVGWFVIFTPTTSFLFDHCNDLLKKQTASCKKLSFQKSIYYYFIVSEYETD